MNIMRILFNDLKFIACRYKQIVIVYCLDMWWHLCFASLDILCHNSTHVEYVQFNDVQANVEHQLINAYNQQTIKAKQ